MFTRDERNRVKPMRETLLIPEFHAIWLADKTAVKEQAMKEFAYIYFVANYKSPFVERYPADKVEHEVKRQIMGNDKYNPPKRVLEALNAFRRLYNPKARELFDLADLAVARLNKELTKRMDKDELDYEELKQMYDLLLKVAPVAKNLDKARKELEDDVTSSKSKGILHTKWEIPGDDEMLELNGIV